MSHASASSSVDMRPAGAGVDVLIRYVTRASDRLKVRNRLYERVIDVLHQAAGGYLYRSAFEADGGGIGRRRFAGPRSTGIDATACTPEIHLKTFITLKSRFERREHLRFLPSAQILSASSRIRKIMALMGTQTGACIRWVAATSWAFKQYLCHGQTGVSANAGDTTDVDHSVPSDNSRVRG